MTQDTINKKFASLEHKICECCGKLPETDGLPIDEPINGHDLVFDPATGIFYYWDGDSWEVSSGGNCPAFYFSVTRAEAETLITGEDLIPGAIYKINDRGDRGIFLEAISATQFSEAGTRLMLVPKTYDPVGIVNGTTCYGIWTLATEGVIGNGQYLIWNAHVYIVNDNGLFDGTSPSINTSAYELISKATFSGNEYVEKVFDILYDWDNDCIVFQKDEYGNSVTSDKSFAYLGTVDDYSYQGSQNQYIDQTDWNYNAETLIEDGAALFARNTVQQGIINNVQPDGSRMGVHDNIALGITNNTNLYAIYSNTTIGSIQNNSGSGIISHNYTFSIDGNENSDVIYYNNIPGSISNNGPLVTTIRYNNNTGGITSNTKAGLIEYNTNQGNITNNSGTGDIYYNDNLGQISSNSNDGDIEYNRNTGEISSNDHNGNIEYNVNNGYIISCHGTNGHHVQHNTNNGNIDNPVGLAAADVTNTIVNK